MDINAFARNDRPWTFLGAVLLDYLWIAASILLCEAVSFWFYPLAFIIIGSRLHALSILMHDRMHSTLWSEQVDRWFSQIFLASPVLLSHTSYKIGHMKHHRHLFTARDPDYPRVGEMARDLQNYSMAGRLWKVFLNSTLSLSTLKRQVLGHDGYQENNQIMPRNEHRLNLAIYLTVFILLLIQGAAYGFFLYWLLPLLIVTRTIAIFRGVIEHDWASESPDPLDNTLNHYGSAAFEFLFFPHGINYHITHHCYPFVPFYHLKALTRKMLDDPGFASQHKHSYQLQSKGTAHV
jgi:fatty acid desaturase